MEFIKIWEIVLRRKWIIISVFLTFFIAVILGTYLVTPTYDAKTKLIIGASDTISSLMSKLGLDTGTKTESEGYETDIALATIKPLLEELISSLNLKNRKGKRIKPDELIKSSFIAKKIFPQPHIEVDQYENADMLEIVSISPDSSEAVNMSNKLAELYINDRRKRTMEEYRAARLFIENRIQNVKEEYFKSLSDLKNFMITEGTVNLSLETQNLIDKIASLKTSFEDNEKIIFTLENEINKVKEQLREINQYRKESEEFTQSDRVNSLKTKINELLISISGKSVEFRKQHPEYKELEKQLETAKEIVKDEAQVVFGSERFSVDPIYDELSKKLAMGYIERETAIAKRRLIQRFIDGYSDALLKIPIKHVENSKLELAISVNKGMYGNLLEYLIQVGIAESMTLSNITIVEPATKPDRPRYPKKSLNYAIGILLGLFWGLGLGLFVEYIDNTIESPEDIEHLKSLTVLGTIPKAKSLKRSNIISTLDPTSPIIESYRMVRNSIQYISRDNLPKSIVITSSVEGEGKSSIAANISLAFKMSGMSIMLIDFNLRRPSLHNFFDVPNDKGLTNVLTEEIELKEVVVHTGLEGLYLLPSGQIPPDPSKLVESRRLKDIINKLKEEFDIVIMDSPPIIPVNDPIVLGAIADGIIYVIESGRVNLSMIEHTIGIIERAGINLIGIVMNKFKVHRVGFYHHYSNRYYKK